MAKPFIDEALLAERQIKGWNHNKKKVVMIRGD
jgi:predicted GIY-YIG superfamily endonuclease